MDKLAKKNRDKVIDVLTERLCYERATVPLYDKIIERMRASRDASITAMLDRMQEHRDQEKEHEEFLEDCVRKLGGDDEQMTEKAKLTAALSQGIQNVIMSDPEIPHLFQALLAAELVDNAGWDLLVELADEAGDRAAVKDFKRCLREEEEHLILMRAAMAKLSAHEVLGEPLQTPRSP